MTKPTGLQYHLQFDPTNNVWADVTPWVLYESKQVEINRGRQDQFSTIQAGTLNAVLDNSDGRFAPGAGYPLGTNYVTNPAFTVDTTSWTASASFTVSPPVDTVRLTANSTAALTFQTTVTLPASAVGTTFTLTARVNATGTVVGKTLSQKVEFYDVSSALITTLTRVTPATLVSGWQTVATTMTVPAGTVTAKVYPVFVPGGWAVADFILLDNVAFTDYSAGRYFDGRQITWSDGATYTTGTPKDTQGFAQASSWTGVADASTSTLRRTSPYAPGLNADCPIRVRFPDLNNHNFVTSAEDASFEGGTVGTWQAYPGWGSVANSAVRAWDGTKSLVITSSTSGGAAYGTITPVTVGLTYTMQVRVWVPAGQPDARLELIGLNALVSVSTSLKAQWATITATFTIPVSFSSNTLLPMVLWNTSTAGQQVWVDGFHFWESSSAPPAFVTGPNPNYLYKYSGYLSALPVQWPGGNSYSEMPITAADRLAPFGRRTLRSVVEEEILSDKPLVYYTLGEAAGSTIAGDSSGNGNAQLVVTQKGAGGTIAFGSGTGPPTDDLPAPIFTPVNTTNYKWLATRFPSALTSLLADKTIVCTINTPAVAGTETLWRIWDGSHWNTMNLNIDGTSTGRLKLSWGFTGNLLSPGRVDDGLNHQVAIVFSGGAYPNITLTMFIDGVQVATTTSSEGQYLPSVNYLDVGGDPKFIAPYSGTMSHFAIFGSALTAARLLAQTTAQKDGFLNERSDQRISRYLRWGGVATADQVLDVGKLTTTDHYDTTGVQLIDAFNTIAVTEGGSVFIDRAGKAAFHARNHRYDAAPFITLGPDDVGPDTQFIVDNQLVVNQVTSSSKTVANLIVADTGSIAARGVYPVSLQLVSTNNADVAYAAQWIVNTSSSPQPRTNGILVDLLTSPQALSDLFKTLEVGATFAVSGLPAQSPLYGANLCVEGWKEVISAEEWSVLINTSIAIPIWKLEDSVYGAIDKTNRIAY